MRNYHLLSLIGSIAGFLLYIVALHFYIYSAIVILFDRLDFFEIVRIIFPNFVYAAVIALPHVIKNTRTVGISLITMGIITFIFTMIYSSFIVPAAIFVISGILALEWKPKEIK